MVKSEMTLRAINAVEAQFSVKHIYMERNFDVHILKSAFLREEYNTQAAHRHAGQGRIKVARGPWRTQMMGPQES